VRAVLVLAGDDRAAHPFEGALGDLASTPAWHS
jgi:hypothetical protein